MCSRSALVTPARSPVSVSAWRTQRCSVSAVQPILAAIEQIAAHCELCSPWCSRTIRTARSRTSGEYFADVFIAPSSQELEPPGKSGRFKGCVGSPVGYIEGWYVLPAWRRQGVGAMLVEAAERWAAEQGCAEMASDIELDNAASLKAHMALGF